MKVALVYNLKKEVLGQQVTVVDESLEPPSQAVDEEVLTLQRPRSTSQAVRNPRKNDFYAEWDTLETITAVKKALQERHNVTLIEANDRAFRKFQQLQPDFVFNMAEGLLGPSRESQIPAILEMLDLPYTGSDPLTLGICLDKSRAKEILCYHNIPTPPFTVLTDLRELDAARLSFPVVVKPLHEGSSKGIYSTSVVYTMEELTAQVALVLDVYGQPALVENYLPGQEFTVALLGNGKALTVLPMVEIRFDSLPEGVKPIYSYEAKWIWDQLVNPLDIFECPAKIDSVLGKKIQDVCRRAFRVLRCRDWCRIDVRLDKFGDPHILELNPVPGILPNPEDNSCFPKAARAAGMTYGELVNSVLDIAAKRCGML
ncbi:MAG: D-alanine--D-alanine ligase [Bacteroidota bacterium]